MFASRTVFHVASGMPPPPMGKGAKSARPPLRSASNESSKATLASPPKKASTKKVAGLQLGRNPSSHPAPLPSLNSTLSDVPMLSSVPGSPADTLRGTEDRMVSFSSTLRRDHDSARASATPSSISSPQPSSSALRKNPRTLREVATQYNFTLESVRLANPALSSMGPDDVIPKGTKLQLPKRNSENTVSPTQRALSESPPAARKSAMDEVLQKIEEAQRTREQQQQQQQQKAEGSAPKKKAPKTLREVAVAYNFPLADVYEANPGLIKLGPDDRIPAGTQLQLPKKRPSIAQVAAQLAIQETQARSVVLEAHAKESENFWFLLGLEKKSLMKHMNERRALWREVEASSDALAQQWRRGMVSIWSDMREDKTRLLSKKAVAGEQKQREAIAAARDQEYAALSEGCRKYSDGIRQHLATLEQLRIEEDGSRRTIRQREEQEYRVIANVADLSRLYASSAENNVHHVERTERDSIAHDMHAERDVIRKKWQAIDNLRQTEALQRNALVAQEHDAREELGRVIGAFVALMRSNGDARRSLDQAFLDQRELIISSEAAQRAEIGRLLQQWDAAVRTIIRAFEELVDQQARSEEKVAADEVAAWDDLVLLQKAHRASVEALLADQSTLVSTEHDDRERIVKLWQSALIVFSHHEAQGRVDAECLRSRQQIIDEEAVPHAQFLDMAHTMHETAHVFWSEMVALSNEAESSHATNAEEFLTLSLSMYLDKASAVSRDEALARRNMVAEETASRAELLESLHRLHALAQRIWAALQDLIHAENSAHTQLGEDEALDWTRMCRWHSSRVKMIAEGKTEVDLLLAEEDEERTGIAAEFEQSRQRFVALEAQSLDHVRRCIADQHRLRNEEVEARQEALSEESHAREGLTRSMAEEGLDVWRQHQQTVLVAMIASLQNEEQSARRDLTQSEGGDRQMLREGERRSLDAAKADEAVRIIREQSLAELKEKQRRERALAERACLDARDSTERDWFLFALGIFRDFGVLDRERLGRAQLEAAHSSIRSKLAQEHVAGLHQVQRKAMYTSSLAERSLIEVEEHHELQLWSTARLAEHYEIWQREAADQIRKHAEDREGMQQTESQHRSELDTYQEQAWDRLLADAQDGLSEAHRQEVLHAEELARAIRAWQEHKFLVRKQLFDEENETRQSSVAVPEANQRARLINAEARGRQKAVAAREERIQLERDAEEQRVVEAERQAEELRRRRAAELQEELARQRAEELQQLLLRQADRRTRFEAYEQSQRDEIIHSWDSDNDEILHAAAVSLVAAHIAVFRREIQSRLEALQLDETAHRAAVESEYDSAHAALLDTYHRRREAAIIDARQAKQQLLWSIRISAASVEKFVDLESEEDAQRRAVFYEYETSYRAWVDAITIEEQFIESKGRRKTTQMLMVLGTDEADERALIMLLEELLRLHIDEYIDRVILAEWEERCTDALHAYVIDTIDALLFHGTGSVRALDNILASYRLHPQCLPRPVFDGESVSLPAATRATSSALIPHPPALVSITGTPARLERRLRTYPLRGEAGTPQHLVSLMERFDVECRSEAATPFAKGLFISRENTGSPRKASAALLPRLTGRTPTRAAVAAIEGLRTPKPPPISLPSAVLSQEASRSPSQQRAVPP